MDASSSSSRSPNGAVGRSRCRRQWPGCCAPTVRTSSRSASPLVLVGTNWTSSSSAQWARRWTPVTSPAVPARARSSRPAASPVPRSPPHLRIPAAGPRRAGACRHGDSGSLADQPNDEHLQPRHALAPKGGRRSDGGPAVGPVRPACASSPAECGSALGRCIGYSCVKRGGAAWRPASGCCRRSGGPRVSEAARR